MHKPRFKFPKLRLSTILIEMGIICALVAVNTRPMSYGPGMELPVTGAQSWTGTLAAPSATPSTSPATTSPQKIPTPSKQDSGPHAQVYDEDSVIVKYTFLGDDDIDNLSIRVANYGWPLKSVEIASDTREIHYVDKQRLAANIAICLALVGGSAIAIEWSVRYSQRKQKSLAMVD
jgi:hypothetical protein